MGKQKDNERKEGKFQMKQLLHQYAIYMYLVIAN